MADIVGIGASLYDMIFTVNSYPKEDTKLMANKVGYQCGGPAATGVATASKMGASTAFLGSFTDDDYAEAMVADFKKYNVDTSCIARKKGYSSGSAVIINSADTASRTIVWTKGNVPETAPDDIDTEAIKKAKMLYLDGNHINAALYACKIAKENGVKVFIDAGAKYAGIENILDFADIVIASEEFAISLSGKESVKDSMRFIAEKYNPEILIVTCGAKGGLYLDAGEAKDYRSYPPPGKVVNTNGAGDVFHGAFAYAYIKGFSLEKSIQFASAAAAIKCTKENVREGVPKAEEVLEYLADY